MKLKCVKNWITDPNGYIRDLCTYLTIDKIYYLSNNPPASEYVYNIIDDLLHPHDISKDLFINVTAIEREEKLKQLGI